MPCCSFCEHMPDLRRKPVRQEGIDRPGAQLIERSLGETVFYLYSLMGYVGFLSSWSLVMTTSAVLTGLLMLTPTASACPRLTSTPIDVVISDGPVAIGADVSLAQISEMANRTGWRGKHAPIGFYFSNFGYTIHADAVDQGTAECIVALRVTITLVLTNRHVQIAKEWAGEPCKFKTARDHYLRHAAADNAVIVQFAQALNAASRQIPLPQLTGDPSTADDERHNIELALTTMVERGLGSLDDARANARETVDTPAEIRSVFEACEPGK
jgi:hypothetical protein